MRKILIAKYKNRVKMFARPFIKRNGFDEISDDVEGVLQIKVNSKLTGKCNGKLILSDGISLRVDNKFEGVIIGKNKNRVILNHIFNGVIVCDFLMCKSNSEVNGDIYINKLIVSEGIIFNVKVHDLNKSDNLII